MEVLETYQELIEADAKNISIWWKLLPMIIYFLSATSSYISAILFYILWHEMFAGNCPLWAQIVSSMGPRLMPDDVPIQVIAAVVSPDWRRKIFVAFKYEDRCEIYHFVSLCSCFFGVTWMILFTICGKGGYDTRKLDEPWRVVPPALVFQFIFVVLTMVVVNDLEYGYAQFATNLQKVASHYNDTHAPTLNRQCDVVQYFFEIYGANKYSVCQIYPALQTFSWIMAWSWFFGLIVLILRVVFINDFKLLTVTIHKIPKDQVHKYIHRRVSSETEENVSNVTNL